MIISNNQETLFYTLELTYSTRCFDQAELHGLTITHFHKRYVLTGHSLLELQPLLHSMTLRPHFSSERQQSAAQYNPLEGSGTRGPIHQYDKATCLWTTRHHTYNPTRWWRICCQTVKKIGTTRLAVKRRLHIFELRLEQELKDSSATQFEYNFVISFGHMWQGYGFKFPRRITENFD